MNSELLQSLYSAEIEQVNGRFMIEVPPRELEIGSLSLDQSYQVGLYKSIHSPSDADQRFTSTSDQSSGGQHNDESSLPERDPGEAPVSEGEIVTVEIHSIGDKGDGIAKTDSGFVLVVPDTNVGDKVEVEIQDVHESYAFAMKADSLDDTKESHPA